MGTIDRGDGSGVGGCGVGERLSEEETLCLNPRTEQPTGGPGAGQGPGRGKGSAKGSCGGQVILGMEGKGRVV